MKRNALIRIVLFSSIILLLTTGLIFGIVHHYQTQYTDIVEAPIEVMPTIVDTNVLHPRIAADAVNVRTSPSSEATAIGMLRKDEWVDVTREETVNGVSWSYITGPVQGWVQSQYLTPGFDQSASLESSGRTEDPAIQETVVSVDIPDSQTSRIYKPDQVQELDIEWVSGSVTIIPWASGTIQISETGTAENLDPMVCRLKEGTLSVDFCKDHDSFLSISGLTGKNKDLTIYVPANWVCQSLELETASASLNVEGLTITEVDFEGASGICDLKNCTVDRMDVDTASGDIHFTGKLQYLDVEAASANVTAILTSTPKRLSLDSMSGDLDVTLPKDAGFTLSMDGMSTDFTSEFATWKQGGDHISGDGSCRILLNAMSGDVFIRKAPAA